MSLFIKDIKLEISVPEPKRTMVGAGEFGIRVGDPAPSFTEVKTLDLSGNIISISLHPIPRLAD